MDNEELCDIYQLVNNIILEMDEVETHEDAELFEKIRWALQEMELIVTRLYNSVEIMEDSMTKFMDAHRCAKEEIDYKYRKPTA